jgi:uncharacterized protein (DUF1501 family)
MSETRNGDSGWSRRRLLQGAALGLAAAALPAREAIAAEADPERNLIFILCGGGPSQLETWDPKPDAPAEVRGPFGAIDTPVAGFRVSETLPRLARLAPHFSVIRSLHTDEPALHEICWQLAHTGRRFNAMEIPHYGAALAALRPHGPTPPFVVLPQPLLGAGLALPHGQGAGALGSRFDSANAEDADVTRAADVSRESETTQERYGKAAFGRSCLAARRLVERGTRCVVVNQFPALFHEWSWDCHALPDLPTRVIDLKDRVCAPFDRAVSALIQDLRDRGLYENTLVCCLGEFGRTPEINTRGGRDHWTGCWSAMLGGGGIPGGQVIGASDARGAEPVERPVTPADLAATIYQALGVASTTAVALETGERFGLVDAGARVIGELV